MTAMNRTGIQYRTLWQPRLILRDPDGAMVQERILPGAHSCAAPALVSVAACVSLCAPPCRLSLHRSSESDQLQTQHPTPDSSLPPPPCCCSRCCLRGALPLVVLTTDYNTIPEGSLLSLGCRARSPPLLPPFRVAMASERCCKSGDLFIYLFIVRRRWSSSGSNSGV